MGAGADHSRRKALSRALSQVAAPAESAPVLELSSYAGRDAPPASILRWRGGQWGTLSWADLVAIMQTAEQSGATEQWGRLTRRMYQDPHLLAIRGTRLDPISGADFDVTPGGPSQADVQAALDVEMMLRGIADLPSRLDAILDGEFVGWSILEIIWCVRGAWVWPEQLDVIEPHRIRFDRLILPFIFDDGRLGDAPGANGQIGLTGMPLRENKFIVHMPRVIPDYAIASGILRSCVRPWWVKWQAAAYWLNGAEVAGNPRAIGKYPSQTPVNVRQNFFDDLQNLSASGVAVIDKEMEVQILNAAAPGSGSVWDALQRWCDDSMTKAVLGSTLNTDVGATGGNRALGESQASTTIDPRLRKSSVSMWSTVVRDLVRPFLQFNMWRYGGRMPAIPTITSRFAEEMEPVVDDLLISIGGATVDEVRRAKGHPEWGPERGGNQVAKQAATGGGFAFGAPAGQLGSTGANTDFVAVGGPRAADPFRPWDMVDRMIREAE